MLVIVLMFDIPHTEIDFFLILHLIENNIHKEVKQS